jgi:hypothetical protein
LVRIRLFIGDEKLICNNIICNSRPKFHQKKKKKFKGQLIKARFLVLADESKDIAFGSSPTMILDAFFKYIK